MEALVLIVQLLEKVSVLISTALFLLLLRPAQVWLDETGMQVSPRRKLFLITIFAPLAVWGIFLGFEIDGLGFNTRAIGIIVAGYLGGFGVGATVGLIAGVIYALLVPTSLAPFVLAASIINGVVAAWWVKQFGVSLRAITSGAIIAQLTHHITLGFLYFVFDWAQAIQVASNIWLHGAKITANTIGVVMFMGMLKLISDLDRARSETKDSKGQIRTARLEALRYQLRPHFLFNLLNTLAYLIRTNPIKARELTLELADFLRYTLTRDDQETTLHQELVHIERYVELEQARFGEGLTFNIINDVPDLTHQVQVPPLILQPLVENAIKHGAIDGKVDINIELGMDQDVMLSIKITDSGPGPNAPMHELLNRTDPTKRQQSVGLRNVKERLDGFYHERALLNLTTLTERAGALAHILLPLEDLPSEPTNFAQKAQARLKDAVISPTETP